MTTYRIAFIILIVVLIISWVYITHLQKLPPRIVTRYKTVTKTIVKQPENMLLSVVLKDLQKDLQANYSFLSQNQQQEILTSIISSSKEFNVNPLIIYSLISVESSFQFYIQSPTRTVVGSDGKKHKDRAIGLMSIIYSIWDKELKANNILSTKTELYQIAPNVRAGTFILALLKKRYKGNTVKALMHYFGKSNYAKTYQLKIRTKIGSLVEKNIL